MGLSAAILARSLRQIAKVFIILVLAANMAAAPIGSIKQPFVRPTAADLRLQIETDRIAHRVGEVIKVRLTLVNSSARTIMIPPTSATSMGGLLVYDAAGRKVDPTVMVRSERFSGPGTDLKPQGEMILRGQEGEWVSLREFGYQFGSPGNYALVGFASMAPPPGYRTLDLKSSALNYNQVAFTITR